MYHQNGKKSLVHPGADTQAVTIVFSFLGWSVLKVIGYYPKLGNVKFHYIHHKIEQYLGYPAEKPIFVSLCFCFSVLDLLLPQRVKKAVLFLQLLPCLSFCSGYHHSFIWPPMFLFLFLLSIELTYLWGWYHCLSPWCANAVSKN